MVRSGELDWLDDGADWPGRAHSRFVAAGGVRWHVRRFGDLEVHVVDPTGIALETPYHPEP